MSVLPTGKEREIYTPQLSIEAYIQHLSSVNGILFPRSSPT